MMIDIQKIMRVKHEDKVIFYSVGDDVTINDRYTGTIHLLQEKRLILMKNMAPYYINYRDIKNINGKSVSMEVENE